MKKRIISAVIISLILIPIVYFGKLPFYLSFLLIGLIAYREIIKLFISKVSIKLISYLAFLSLVLTNINKINFNSIIEYNIIGIIILIFAFTALYNHQEKSFNTSNCFKLLGITILLSISFSVMIIVRNISIFKFMYLFLIAIFTDVFAYFTGIIFGKHKINEISPNKTWEGVIGGTFFGVVFPSIFYLYFVNNNIFTLKLIIITFLLSIIGQMGDLFFSLIKRNNYIKDFSNVMPGHGGILDRFDSIIFIMLAYTYFINLL